MRNFLFIILLLFVLQSMGQAPSPKELAIEQSLQVAASHLVLDSTILLAQATLAESTSNNYTEGVAKSLQLLAQTELKKGNFANALTNYLKLLPVLKKTADRFEIIQTYIAIGDIHFLENLFEQALGYYTQADSLLTATDQEQKLVILNKMANAYYKSNQPNKALEKLDVLYDHYSKRNELAQTVTVLEKRVDNYLLQENYEAALRDNQWIIGLLKQRDHRKEIAIAYNNLAYTYIKLKNYQELLIILILLETSTAIQIPLKRLIY
ncbi:MAG: tetratricopeptide repeat protein [Saprospiraceae bacterium]|nr:tetratricopeptide repeat protein [Saprospiraceae bacterium]